MVADKGEQMANASQNAPPSVLEPRRAYKPRKTLKSPRIQATVLTKRAMGESKSKIARDLGMANNTVTSIIELNDFDKEIELGKIGCVKLIPKSIQAMEQTLDKGDGYLGIKLLTGLGILGSEGKPAKPQAPTNLHLQIMNLVGKPITENKAVSSDTSTIAVPDNSAIDV